MDIRRGALFSRTKGSEETGDATYTERAAGILTTRVSRADLQNRHSQYGSRYHSNLFWRKISTNLIQRQGMHYTVAGVTYDSDDVHTGIGSTKLNELTIHYNFIGSREPHQHNNIRDRLGKS